MRKIKKKVRIKKKNMAFFIIFIMLFTYVSAEIILSLTDTNKKELTKEVEQVKKEKKKKNKSKAKEMNNMQDLSYYYEKYQERYDNYKKDNPTISDEQVVKDVNMQLDKKHYEDTIPAKNLNTNKILVNKYYYLENDYVPKNLESISKQYALDGMKLVKEAKDAFEKLAKDAARENLNIISMSAYRSYDYQVKLYNKYVKTDGKEKADTYSGRAGHSEHQTGLATDVYNQKETYTNFEKTKEYKWMLEHAHEYGFILRFPKDKEKETGYQFESWHYRYVGKEAAKYIKENNISFEEYYATIIKDW